MKFTVQQVFDATLALATIIREERALPQKGRYRLLRLHGRLLPEFNAANAQRDKIISELGAPVMREVPDPTPEAPLQVRVEPTGQVQVPPDKMALFNEQWGEIAKQEIDVDVEQVPESYLCFGDEKRGDQGLTFQEMITLQPFVDGGK